ncbi:hypothetical protein GCM10010466_03860 [Planomonospora alba]|uniref:Uncharacterized protein n=1 Tax=Planomonospora alba TaxID=161354 RepID=A0ABP6MK97_9ACTN
MVRPLPNGDGDLRPARGGKRAGPDAEGNGSAHSPHGGCLMDDDSKAFARRAGSVPDRGPGSGPVDAAWARPAPAGA